MIRASCLSSFLFVATLSLFSQTPSNRLEGEVSYVTSQNVYVKFDQTGAIQVGDELRVLGMEKACLKITNKSSRSVVCTAINDCVLKKGDRVVYLLPLKPKNDPPGPVVERVEEEVKNVEPVIEDLAEEESFARKEIIRARITVSNYQTIASARDNRNRLMGRFWLDATHINHSKVSLVAQGNYRQVFFPDFSPPRTFFNVYNLAVIYDVDSSFSITAGRRINPKTASLGAIDGLQAEKYFGNSYVGVIAGSRPDITTYSPNFNLLEYGGYVGRETRNAGFYSQTTLGLIEQRNTGAIDRRYAYFQHSSTIARSLSLFSSLELDLYQSVNGVKSNTVRLPNLYLAGTYRFGRKASLMLSYDSRKRVLYYETFQTEIERMLQDDLAREGVRARLNFRPIKYMNIGLSAARRFQNDNQNKSDNLHGSISYSRLPGIGGRISAAYNMNSSNYLNSNILSVRYSRTLLPKRLNADVYYRMADYVFVNSNRIRRQQYYGANLALQLDKQWGIRLAVERGDFNQETNYRVYARITKRFYRSR